MNVLVIGDANSIYTKSYIDHVLKNEDNVVLATSELHNENYRKFYTDSGVEIEEFAKSPYYLKVPYIRSNLCVKLWAVAMTAKYGTFDYIHVHGLNISRGNLMLYLKKPDTNVIISVWGSELLRGTDKSHRRFKKYFDKSKYITVENSLMKEKFIKVYDGLYDDKTVIVEFGDDLIKSIDEVSVELTREEICKEFGISSENVNVCIGYNRNPAHQHDKVLDELLKLPSYIQKNITLIFPMTYGPKDEEYLSSLDEKINSFAGESIKFTEFLPNRDTVKITCVTDVFIHAQISDAQSMTLLEHLYSGSIVLNGSWLEYPVMKERNIVIQSFNDFSDFYNCFENVMKNFDAFKKSSLENKAKLEEFMSWDKVSDKWKNLFN